MTGPGEREKLDSARREQGKSVSSELDMEEINGAVSDTSLLGKKELTVADKIDLILADKESLNALTDKVTTFTSRLGTFERTSVSLKPGRYIVVGSRAGYRDVRIEFTLTDKGLDSPITISCNEAI